LRGVQVIDPTTDVVGDVVSPTWWQDLRCRDDDVLLLPWPFTHDSGEFMDRGWVAENHIGLKGPDEPIDQGFVSPVECIDREIGGIRDAISPDDVFGVRRGSDEAGEMRTCLLGSIRTNPARITHLQNPETYPVSRWRINSTASLRVS
jgi:hypothetical protein